MRVSPAATPIPFMVQLILAAGARYDHYTINLAALRYVINIISRSSKSLPYKYLKRPSSYYVMEITWDAWLRLLEASHVSSQDGSIPRQAPVHSPSLPGPHPTACASPEDSRGDYFNLGQRWRVAASPQHSHHQKGNGGRYGSPLLQDARNGYRDPHVMSKLPTC